MLNFYDVFKPGKTQDDFSVTFHSLSFVNKLYRSTGLAFIVGSSISLINSIIFKGYEQIVEQGGYFGIFGLILGVGSALMERISQ